MIPPIQTDNNSIKSTYFRHDIYSFGLNANLRIIFRTIKDFGKFISVSLYLVKYNCMKR